MAASLASSLPLPRRGTNALEAIGSAINMWNSQIRGSVYQNNPHKAFSLYRQMKQNGVVHPDNFTFPFLLKACALLSHLPSCQALHTHLLKSPFYPHVFVQTALLDAYLKCDHLPSAHQLFEKMPHRDVASWNAMLLGFAQMGFPDRALVTFREMRVAGVLADAVTVIGVSKAVVETLEWAKGIHSFGVRIGVDADVSVANTWISLYAKCGDLDLAESVFCGIEAPLRTVVSWNSMIAGYAHFEDCVDALRSYRWMLREGFRPDSSTIISLLSSCAQPQAIRTGMLVHSNAIRVGSDADICVVNTLISMYCKCGDVDSARQLFDGMHDRSCVSWTAMISGYAEKGDLDEASTLFTAMELMGQKPDMVTVLSMISGCGQAGDLEVGKKIDAYASYNGLKHYVVVCNALIDMYAKCGSINDARYLFNAMKDRTVVSWTAIISGCALNGLFEEALDLFYNMEELGLKPNHITFLAVLQACTHAGFLEKGLEFFKMMMALYQINPGLDHCSCIVDLLGRKGKLKQALDFILNMPMKPDAAIWSALLAACKIHKNIEIGEYAHHHLLELEPYAAFPYVGMANLYASEERWNEVASIRTLMKHKGVKKPPGKSFIEVNGKNHAFTAEDRKHYEEELIYAVLNSLFLQSKHESSSRYSDVALELESESGVMLNM
ncbi:hypothetical protein Tsubulata_000258 [Turnera subulata]|uniref:Pentacotripeptide-repeat region of PRORP domain-containing protein n=1 Tax=Turnera subulata TaxID=218843 RepID=A0A9Q0JFU3_9ROSI|nr:hypothetical protein Tsubulata_000258 [Turnera subulata]